MANFSHISKVPFWGDKISNFSWWKFVSTVSHSIFISLNLPRHRFRPPDLRLVPLVQMLQKVRTNEKNWRKKNHEKNHIINDTQADIWFAGIAQKLLWGKYINKNELQVVNDECKQALSPIYILCYILMPFGFFLVFFPLLSFEL